MKKGQKFLSLVLVALMLVMAVPLAHAEDDTYEVGDILCMSKVTDEALLAELNALAPEWEDWISYGYYSGDGYHGSMVQGDWMRYTDVTYGGKKYRAVKFARARPNHVLLQSMYSNQEKNGYIPNVVYWFKFEPINWRILDPDAGLIMCETIVDAQPYSNTIYYKNGTDTFYGYFNDSFYTNYASDYVTSSIRQWLNEDFYNTAFSSGEKKEISTTVINNADYYTSIDESDYGMFYVKSISDKIFLLSYSDTNNISYGFSSNDVTEDSARKAQGCDYAKCQGLGEVGGYSSWFLCTPSSSLYSYGVYCYGNSNVDLDVGSTHGIRPALIFNDIDNFNHTHNYTAIVTLPTCTAQGYTTYTCSCGDTYTETIEATGHNFDGSKCIKCGYDKAEECSCNCHKGGLAGFFFKIINFFQKLFGINKVCACGVTH